ncbi:MAG: amino acid adenylation domain-containing protein [Flavobacteriales bacterium]|jgi:amino acid adenylation domain-containing protein
MINKIPAYPNLSSGKCIHEAFEWMATKAPNNEALVVGTRSYSYKEVDEKANQLAHYLIAQNVQKEELIAISMERSAEMIISILGVLKAGGAYLPIDPQTPVSRCAYILEESKSAILLTQKQLVSNFDHFKGEKLLLNGDLSAVEDQPKTAVNIQDNPKQLAYTIFTSGSTGKPKGVQVEHHSVINLIRGQVAFAKQPVERFLFAYSFAFDGSVVLTFWTLLTGGTLVMAEEGLEKDISKIAKFIAEKNISHLLTFASLYGLLLERTDSALLVNLKHVSVAGEICPPALVKKHHNTVTNCVLFNAYGPTEATVGATIYKTSPADANLSRVPIGKPIDRVRCYILDENLKELKVGEIGNLYLSGDGLARGYLNKPEMTREKFIPNPFDEFPFDRLYKTGDLAMWTPTGEVDFIGRADFQVKLRGYRIEPGEIEATLMSHKNILATTILLKGEESADQKLVAYLVAKPDAVINISELRNYVSEKLPEYMIPAVFVLLEKMPLTTAGKVDRVALPEPGKERPLLANSYSPPKTELEQTICQYWQGILQLEKIGIHDKFFELGGNSLQAADFIARLQKELGEVIFITSIFDHPTISAFAKMLERDYATALSNGSLKTKDSLGEGVTPNNKDIASTASDSKVLTKSDFQDFENYFPKKNLKPKANTKKLKPAVFILAPPRSGTSLLRIMLAGHSKLFASNELQLLHFNTLEERASAYQGKFQLWSEGLVRMFMELESCSADKAKTILQQYTNKGYSTKEIYALLQEKIGDVLLVDKSPSYALDVDALKKAEVDFENPIYIHLVRHPYAMVQSFSKMHMDQVMYLKPHEYTAQNLGELIWTKSHQNITDFLNNVPANRKFQLQYENLVKRPEELMRQLCEQLNWEYDPALVNPYDGLEEKMVDGLYQNSTPMGDIRLLEHGKIDPKLADSWKGVEKDNFLSEETWEKAESFGYTNPQKENFKPEGAKSKSKDIAIIGMSVRLPGADNIEAFWQNLKNETDVSKSFTKEDLAAAGLDPALLDNPDFVNRGMPLKDPGHFAAEFFGYLPKEAALMDPQHRVFLECAYTALENSGYHSESENQRIGIYGAVARNTYLVNNVITHPNYFKSIDDFQLGITLEKDFPATRVAYKLDLKGPAINIQTACSSSGVALHLACQNLLLNESDVLLVGGGRIQPPVQGGHLHKEGHALSPDGYVRAFDAEANGMVRGHGMAFIVIKKLEKAIADGDTVHAVIKGSAIGNDGADKIGFTAPAIEGQCRTIVEAYKKIGIDPATLSYVEAHGTGTRLGDPIEIAALTKAFATFTNKKTYCALGTVKTNIGHLDAGACIAGIIKTALSMKAEFLPASLHFNKPNPQIPFDQSPFYINGKGAEWKKGELPRRAGVSSFGLGGTNVHVILEEAPELIVPTKEHSSELLILSAKTPTALEEATVQLGHFMEKNKGLSLTDIAATLQVGRKSYDHRVSLLAENIEEVTKQLQENNPQFLTRNELRANADKIVFMFPGGGAQHSNMGLGLYQTERVFRDKVDECLTIFQEQHQLDLRSILYPAHAESNPITDPLHGITLLFTIEWATAQLWISKGIQPTEMIGHSLGEYVAACLAGVFTLEEALAMVATRGKLFLQLEEGGMLSIPLSEKEVSPYMDEELSFAAINKPDYCVVSGPVKAIDRIKEKLTKDEIHAPRLHINVAAHSTMVESILEEFGSFLETINYCAPKIPIVSNLDGKYVKEETMQGADYWKRHLRQTVRFAEGISTLLTEEQTIFLEIGPAQTLSNFTRQHPNRSSNHIVIASLRHPKEVVSDRSFLLKSMGQLWLNGCTPDWKQNFESIHRISLPTYPFERKRYWIDPKEVVSLPSNDVLELAISPNVNQELEEPKRIKVMFTRKDWLKGEVKNIFHQLSGLPVANMDDYATFLELGFDSLFLTQSITKIKKAFGIKLNFRQLFDEAPGIDALAGFLDRKLEASAFQTELAALNEVETQPQSQNQDLFATGNAASGSLEQIIQQQLLLMQQQLDLLKGGIGSTTQLQKINTEFSQNRITNSTVPSQPLDGNGIDSFVNKAASTSKEFTAFGPWVPIEKKRLDDLTEREKKYLQDLIYRYTIKTKGSQEISARQRKHMADPRSIVGFNRIWKEMVYQIAMDRSKGSKLWDVDGNEYIDFRSSFGCNLFGNSPDFIQDAIKVQIDKGFELGVLTPLAEQVCDLICELTGTERVSLVNTGSEAVSAAVRAARTATGKDKIIVFEGDYHGIADELLVKGINRGGKAVSLPAAPGIPVSLVDQVIVLKWDDPDIIQKIKDAADDLAAVLIEPVQPNDPTHQPIELLRAIRKVTEEEEVAMIYDEMITGFRVGLGGAQSWYGIEVDIIAYGKVLSGGLPMAAVAGKSQYLDVFDGGQWQFGDASIPEAGVTFFGGTFCKHPVSLAASLAALKEMKRQGQPMYDALNEKTARFAERLIALFEQTKVPIQVRSTASIIAIKIVDRNPLAEMFWYYMRLKGIFIENKAAIMTLAHSEADLDHTFLMFEETIREMQTAGFFPITVAEISIENKIVGAPLLYGLDCLSNATAIKKKIPLTEGQKEVWVEHQLGSAAAAAYNLSGVLQFEEELNIDLMRKAVQQLVNRHESLRTIYDADELVQHIFPELEIDIPFLDISDLEESEIENRLSEIHEAETTEVLDLFKGPLFRVKIIQTKVKQYQLIMTAHHGIADGWSCGVLAKELAALYTGLKQNKKARLPKPAQLSDFVSTQQIFQQSEEAKETADYWLKQFEEDVPVLDFPTDFPRPLQKTYNASLESIELDQRLTQQLKEYSNKNRSTLFVTLYTAFQTLIHRLSGQDDFVLGMVAATRSIAGNENLVAHGVSLLPLRSQINPTDDFPTHLQKMRNQILDSFDYQQYTLGSLVKVLKMSRDPSRQPIISILFNMDGVSEALDFDGMKVEVNPIVRKYETFDVFINVKPLLDGSISFEWIYNTDLFLAESIQRHLAEFKTLLEGILSEPTAKIYQLPILPEAEKVLLQSWNNTEVSFPDQNLVHQLFEEQVLATPSNIAVFSDRQELSYQGLNEKANQLARFLGSRGVQKGSFVGVYLSREVHLLSTLLAVTKVGGIYVPLDPSNPKDRLRTIVEDADCGFLITEQSLVDRLPIEDAIMICLNKDKKSIQAQSKENLNLDLKSEDLVYVNYTSGSSGKPKGVLIPHYAVIDHHLAVQAELQLNEEDVICSVASVAFDPSVQDYFLPLFLGASVTIVSEETKTDGFSLTDYLQKVKPTLMQATPSTWRMLLLAGWKGEERLTILSGGEGLTKDLSSKLITKCKRLYNIYGPTETTIWSTLKRIDEQTIANKTISGYEPVGRPLQNVQVYILDAFKNEIPIGAVGELYIGGVGVAPNGYFKRTKLTEEKFINLPISKKGKLYRTGDLGRYLPNGDIEYLNRVDNQVKIRGFRIELGEIESVLATYKGIRENVVIIREDQPSVKKLVAYVVMNANEELEVNELRNWLSDKLPDYMVPLDFVVMDAFPMTATSKINRNKLPIPTYVKTTTEQGLPPPSSIEEIFLIDLWKELLSVSEISIHDNFFELGGHSLIAVSMIARIEKETGNRLPLAALLEYNTVSRLAKLLQKPQSVESNPQQDIHNSLIPIKREGSKPPIYLVHGAGLHVLMFQTLAAHMGKDQPIYALQARGLDGHFEPLDNIEAIAAHYLSEILIQNPNGPYFLAGYSFGGLIAFEMARQLKVQGKEIAMLGMFDTEVRFHLSEKGQSKSYYQQLKGLTKKVGFNISLLARNPIENAKYKTHVLKRYYQRWKWSRQSEEEMPQNDDQNFAALVDQMNLKAFEAYRIQDYDGPIHLFRATEKRFYLDDFEYLGWKPYAKKGVIIRDVPGDHLNLFNSPNGPTFASILQEEIDKVLNASKGQRNS